MIYIMVLKIRSDRLIQLSINHYFGSNGWIWYFKLSRTCSDLSEPTINPVNQLIEWFSLNRTIQKLSLALKMTLFWCMLSIQPPRSNCNIVRPDTTNWWGRPRRRYLQSPTMGCIVAIYKVSIEY